MKHVVGRYLRVTAEAEVDISEFDDDTIVEYMRERGYFVSKDPKSDEPIERFPVVAKDAKTYIAEFCKLNGLNLTLTV